MDQRTREGRKKNVIDVLNQARGLELQAIAQYMNQHYNLDAMDYGDLAAKMKLIAIDEMRHAEMFADRIKELGGEPTAELGGGVETGQDVKVIYPFAMGLETEAIDSYNRFLLVCRENGDSTSVKLFERIIDEEQIHLNYFESVKDHIQKLGETYLAKVAGTPSATGLQTQGFAARQGGTPAA